MKFRFTRTQSAFVQSLDLAFDPLSDLNDDQVCELSDAVADYLTQQCFDENYAINDEGRICESILDAMTEQED